VNTGAIPWILAGIVEVQNSKPLGGQTTKGFLSKIWFYQCHLTFKSYCQIHLAIKAQTTLNSKVLARESPGTT
jgi:hypothetical protein